MKIDVLSLFPKYFKGPFDVSIIKRAVDAGLLDINQIDIRDFSKDKHQKVDDRPFGGGPGMVMQPEPLCSAIRSVKKNDSHVVYLTPQGKPLTSSKCKSLSRNKHLVLICGHYEGIDQRVINKEVDEEISIGDFVTTNGCIAAIALIDAVTRFIPRALGHPDAALKDTFENDMFEGPQYTRPEVFEGEKVPEVLKNGNHKEIEEFKMKEALKKMKKNRADLYFKYLLSAKQKVKKEKKLLEK